MVLLWKKCDNKQTWYKLLHDFVADELIASGVSILIHITVKDVAVIHQLYWLLIYLVPNFAVSSECTM